MSEQPIHEEVFVTDEYAGKDRRKPARTLDQLELDILRMFEQFEQRHRQMVREMREEILSGFPGGDLKGHCDYHKGKIRAAQAEEEFWKAAKAEALKQGITGAYAVLKLVGILAILSMAYKVGLGPAAAKIFGVAP